MSKTTKATVAAALAAAATQTIAETGALAAQRLDQSTDAAEKQADVVVQSTATAEALAEKRLDQATDVIVATAGAATQSLPTYGASLAQPIEEAIAATKAQLPAPPKPAELFVIRALRPRGFCRAGRRWSAAGDTVSRADFTDGEWAALTVEPMLSVTAAPSLGAAKE